MTAQALAAPDEDWPEGRLFHSHLGLFPFQEEDVARAYLEMEDGGGMMAAWDTGTGKSVLTLALSALYFEDDMIDLVLLVAERNKIGDDEWCKDIPKFTRLTYLRHHGQDRMKRLEKRGMPQILVTTYETAKSDLSKVVKIPGKRGKSYVDGPLMPYVKGKRVLLVLDESTKVANRSSDTYKSWERSIRHIRKAAKGLRVLELTATPIETGWENAFNQLRLADPTKMPLIKDWDEYFIRARDHYDRPRYHESRMHYFVKLAGPMVMRRRKSDPDIVRYFPKKVEEARWFDLADDQFAAYRMVEELQEGQDEPVPGLWTVLRQLAGHPEAIVRSARKPDGSMLAKMLVEELGEDYFMSLSSAKATGLVDYLNPLVKGQGAKAVVFSFFGQSIIPVLARDLGRKHFKTYVCHGGMSLEENAETRLAFRTDPRPAVLLTSDVGARGVNLPEATYVCEFESALTYANRTQRLNRIHRIDSESESVTCMTFFCRDTVEAKIAANMIDRNKQTDQLLGDDDAGEEFMTASDRMEALQIARNRKKRRRAA